MFDNPPSNLPFEPPKPASEPTPASVPPTPVPMAPGADPMPRSTMRTKKEPEDIFSGLEDSGPTSKPMAMPDIPEPPRRSPWVIIALVVGIVVLLGGGAFAFYRFVYKPSVQAPSPATEKTPTTTADADAGKVIEQPPVNDQVQAPVTTPPAGTNIPLPEPNQPTTSNPVETVPSSTTTEQAPAPSPEGGSSNPAPSTPGVVAIEGADADGDGLTDAEELLYGSLSQNRDTDGDGYGDGDELKGFYSPLAKGAGITSMSSIKVGFWGDWSMLMPSAWSMNEVPGITDAIAINTGTMERLAIRTVSGSRLTEVTGSFTNQPSLWRVFTTKNGFTAHQSTDGMKTYVDVQGTMLEMTYDPSGSQTMEFRTTYGILVNSIRPVKK